MAWCLPAWHDRFILPAGQNRRLHSGCDEPVDGYIECEPEVMRQRASQRLGRDISMQAYTLARYISSEHGSGSPEEKMLLALLAIRQARQRGQDVHRLLACTNDRHVCRYGPVHTEGLAHPYERWASTAADPTVDSILVAEYALAGRVGDEFTHGANDQWGARYFLDDLSWVERKARAGHYWVGPIPGVDHFQVFAFRDLATPAASPLGQALIAYTVRALRAPPPDWSRLQPCRDTPTLVLVAALGLLVFAGLGVGLGRWQGHAIRWPHLP